MGAQLIELGVAEPASMPQCGARARSPGRHLVGKSPPLRGTSHADRP